MRLERAAGGEGEGGLQNKKDGAACYTFYGSKKAVLLPLTALRLEKSTVGAFEILLGY